jgi:hypothetical protein
MTRATRWADLCTGRQRCPPRPGSNRVSLAWADLERWLSAVSAWRLEPRLQGPALGDINGTTGIVVLTNAKGDRIYWSIVNGQRGACRALVSMGMGQLSTDTD